jgi:hypothetical protein
MGEAQAVAHRAAPRTSVPGSTAGPGDPVRGATQAGDPTGIGIAHRKAA